MVIVLFIIPTHMYSESVSLRSSNGEVMVKSGVGSSEIR